MTQKTLIKMLWSDTQSVEVFLSSGEAVTFDYWSQRRWLCSPFYSGREDSWWNRTGGQRRCEEEAHDYVKFQTSQRGSKHGQTFWHVELMHATLASYLLIHKGTKSQLMFFPDILYK